MNRDDTDSDSDEEDFKGFKTANDEKDSDWDEKQIDKEFKEPIKKQPKREKSFYEDSDDDDEQEKKDSKKPVVFKKYRDEDQNDLDYNKKPSYQDAHEKFRDDHEDILAKSASKEQAKRNASGAIDRKLIRDSDDERDIEDEWKSGDSDNSSDSDDDVEPRKQYDNAPKDMQAHYHKHYDTPLFDERAIQEDRYKSAAKAKPSEPDQLVVDYATFDQQPVPLVGFQGEAVPSPYYNHLY